MATETTEQIVREAPEIEAYKLGLLKSARELADKPITLPIQQIAGQTGLQTRAAELAEQGIGQYLPYLTEGGFTMGDAYLQLDAAQERGTDILGTALTGIPEQVSAAQSGMAGAIDYGLGATGAAEENLLGAAEAARRVGAEGAQQLTDIRGQIPGIVDPTQRALGQAGKFGMSAAEQGIAGLVGTGGQFDPSAISGFMSPFEDAAVQAALQDIRREGDIAQQDIGARAVGQGAFGGSRQAVAEQELQRNVLGRQAQAAAQMRAQGFESAAQRAQQAYEQALGRQQQAASLTGQLGQAGAATGLQAAQAVGQFGLQGAQQAGALAQTAAQMGISTEELAGRLAQQAGALGQSQAQLGLSGSQAAGQLGLAGQQQAAQVGQTIGQLGLQTGEALGTLGLRQASLGELGQQMGQQEAGFLMDVGKQQQLQQQAVLEAQRQSDLAQLYEPYQRFAFLSDIYKGAPSSQQTIAASTAPSVSPAQQFLGMGIAGLSAAAGAQKAGLFG